MEKVLTHVGIICFTLFCIYIPGRFAEFFDLKIYGMATGIAILGYIMLHRGERRGLITLINKAPFLFTCFWSIALIFWDLLALIISSDLSLFNKFAVILGDIIGYFALWALMFYSFPEISSREMKRIMDHE